MVTPTGENMKLNLFVLRCKDIEVTKKFYEKLGFEFIEEQHGKGPVHYSCDVGGVLLELYPLKGELSLDQSRLGFSIELKYIEAMQNEMLSSYEFDGIEVMVVQDPDGRKIELREDI